MSYRQDKTRTMCWGIRLRDCVGGRQASPLLARLPKPRSRFVILRSWWRHRFGTIAEVLSCNTFHFGIDSEANRCLSAGNCCLEEDRLEWIEEDSVNDEMFGIIHDIIGKVKSLTLKTNQRPSWVPYERRLGASCLRWLRCLPTVWQVLSWTECWRSCSGHTQSISSRTSRCSNRLCWCDRTNGTSSTR